jgi:hypothetical protein
VRLFGGFCLLMLLIFVLLFGCGGFHYNNLLVAIELADFVWDS